MHLFLRGARTFNMVETNTLSTTLLVRSILGRRFLTVGDLVALMGPHELYDGQAFDAPVTYLGIERPEGLPAGSEVITLDRLADLVPGSCGGHERSPGPRAPRRRLAALPPSR